MLTVSLHGIRIQAPIGMYKEEHILGNTFEVDVDVWAATQANGDLPFIDYTVINNIVMKAFTKPEQLLEGLAQHIHQEINQTFSNIAKIKVCIRKLNPPMTGCIQYAQVCIEK